MATPIAEIRVEERRARRAGAAGPPEDPHLSAICWSRFATPHELALSLPDVYAQSLIGNQSVRFLDPAIGTGSFFSALSQVFPKKQIHRAVGVEVDPLFAGTAREFLEGEGLKVVEGDFTKQPTEPLYNLILTNPPYVRHHHIPGPEKEHLRGRLGQSLPINVSGLSGLYCYFPSLLSRRWIGRAMALLSD